MRSILRAASGRLFAAAALLLVPAALSAQALPSAAELMAAYNKAVGGEAALAKYEGMRTTGNFAIPSMGMSAGFEVYSARPNKMLTVIAIPGMGEMRQGHDGTVAWAVDPMRGARILEGLEKNAITDQADFDSSLRLARYFKSAETVEKTTMGGQECYKVKLVWNSGRETFDCYSLADGLLIARVETQQSDMGAIEAVTLLQDYSDFGGVRLPKKMLVTAMGMEQVMTIEAVDYAAIDASRFELPAEIKALVK